MVAVDDSVEFTFKGNHFTAKVLRGGLVGQCTLQRPHETSPQTILEGVASYTSLTAWTEACLQDVLEEYYTRYSSWKRVTHVQSKRTMGDLRDQCKVLNEHDVDTKGLYQEIVRLQNTITEMNTYIERLFSGETLPKRTWTFPSVCTKPQTTPVPSLDKIDSSIHSTTQTMLLQFTT